VPKYNGFNPFLLKKMGRMFSQIHLILNLEIVVYSIDSEKLEHTNWVQMGTLQGSLGATAAAVLAQVVRAREREQHIKRHGRQATDGLSCELINATAALCCCLMSSQRCALAKLQLRLWMSVLWA